MTLRLTLVVLLALFAAVLPIRAQDAVRFDEGKPLDLPLATPPGPATWLLGQPYGNTVGGFLRGLDWYEAGQGLHFGIDISMPCGTPLVAMADGVVTEVDNRSFGSGPHNLIIRHDAAGVTALYGHLLQRPALEPGQAVTRGQEVAHSGDPDETCVSRPHLHLEIRALNYRTAYNPVQHINAAWHTLTSIGSFSAQQFERDLDNARRWLTLLDQPDTAFGGALLNRYPAAWPAADMPPNNPPLARTTSPLPDARWTLRRLGYDGCCLWPWWHATDAMRLYTIDGLPGERASIYEWVVGDVPAFARLRAAPPPFASPDGQVEVRVENDVTIIRRVADGAEWTVDTNAELPAFSADNGDLMWHVRNADTTPSTLETWVSGLDGSNPRLLATQRGGYAVWLDASRVLQVASEDLVSTIRVHDVDSGEVHTLGQWERVRGVDVAPGGGRIAFYRAFLADPAENGVYVLDTTPGAQPVRLPWFGGWRWRDADSLFYLPFNPSTNEHRLHYYDLRTGEDRALTDPAGGMFTVANGDWSVSADGRRIAFLNANDLRLWLLEAPP